MRSTLVLVSLLFVACSDPAVKPDAPLPIDAMVDAAVDAPPIPESARQLDILFVIDDSPSMADKQASLRANYPLLMSTLATFQGGLPNVHIGVVSTDLGTSGSVDTAPGPAIGSGPGSCAGYGKAGDLLNPAMVVSGKYIIDVKNTDGSRTKNYSGTLEQAFLSIADVGASGCGFSQPLEAAKRALTAAHPSNQGFLRPDAYLALVFITDSDDCSLARSSMLGPASPALGPLDGFRCNRFGHTCDVGGTTPDEMNQVGTKTQCHSNESSLYLNPIAGYVSFFKALKTDPLKVIVSQIRGAQEPYQVELRTPPGGGSPTPAIAHSCSYTSATGLEVADPAVRLQGIHEQFPNRASVSTICQQTPDPLYLIAQLLATP